MESQMMQILDGPRFALAEDGRPCGLRWRPHSRDGMRRERAPNAADPSELRAHRDATSPMRPLATTTIGRPNDSLAGRPYGKIAGVDEDAAFARAWTAISRRCAPEDDSRRSDREGRVGRCRVGGVLQSGWRQRTWIGVRCYLRPDRDEIMLAAWPADTLTGAKIFYANRQLVQAFRDQGRIEAWQLKPSFRFGYRDGTRLVEMSGDIDVDSYIAMSTNAVLGRSERMKRPGRLSRADWVPYLRNLVELRIATDDDCDRFQAHFARFGQVDARPGLELSRRWATEEAEVLDSSNDFVGAVRAAFHVLAGLCQA